MAMFQVFQGGTGAITNATRYYRMDGCASAVSVEVYARNMICEAGSLENLTVTVTADPGGVTSRTFTIMKNGSATTLAVTIASGSTTASTTANDLALVAGDRISLRGTVSGAPAAAAAYWSADFIPTTTQRCTWGGCTNGDISTNVATRYAPLGAGGTLAFISTTAAAAATLWNIDATITAVYIELDADPGVGNSWAFTIYKNGSSVGASTVTLGSGETTKNVTGLTIDIAPGDVFAMESLPTSNPTNSGVRYGIAYTPDVDGQWNICLCTPDSNDYTNGHYTFLNAGQDFEDATENLRFEGAHSAGDSTKDWHIKSSRGKLNTAPGGSETRTFTLRKNGGDTANVLSFSAAGTTATSAQAVDFDAAAYCSMLLNKSASAASSIFQVAFLAANGLAPPAGGSHGSLLLLGVGT